MSSNPFLNAINFQPPAQSTQPFDRQSYINNMLSNMHGANLAPLQTGGWQPDDNFINAMANYSKSGASGSPSIPGALSNAQAPQGSGSSSGPSFIDRLKNAAGDAWNQTIGKEYSQAKGGLEGLLTGLLSGVNVHTGQAQAPQNVLDPLTGFYNPQQEAQKYQTTKDSMGKGVLPWALSTAADTVTDPLTYAPIGGALKVLGKVTGATDALKAAGSAIKDSGLVNNKVVTPLVNQLGKNFVKYYGASQGVKDALQQNENMLGFHNQNIQNELVKLAQQHALTEQERNILPHVWEGTEVTTNPKVLQAIQDLKDALQNGIGPTKGMIGTNAELTTKLNDQPILQRLRQNYFPHIYRDNPEMVRQIIDGQPTKSFSTTGPFNQVRQMNTLEDAINARLNPVTDPYLAIGHRLMQSAKAITNANTINDLLNQGLISKSELPDTVRSQVLNSLKWLEQRTPEATGEAAATQETIPNELAHQYKGQYTPGELNTLEQSFGQQRDNLQNQLNSLGGLAKQLRDTAAQGGHADLLKTIRSLGGVRTAPGQAFHSELSSLPANVKAALRGVVHVTQPESLKAGEFQLPSDLARSAPKYRSNPLQFANDFDKAAYVVRSSKNLSNRDADFLSALMKHTGLTEQEVRGLGEKVKGAIHNTAKGVGEGETIKLPSVLNNISKKLTMAAKGLPLDEMANQLGMSARTLLDTLSQATTGQGKLRVGDFMNQAKDQLGHEQLTQDLNQINDHINAIQSAQQLHKLDEVAAARSGADPLSDSGNFDSLVNSFGKQEEKPGLVRYFVNPNDENALKQALNPYKEPGAFMNMYDKAQGLWKTGALYNPLIHGHNIGINGMWLGGAKPADVLSAWKDIRTDPSASDYFQRALMNGAISADRGGLNKELASKLGSVYDKGNEKQNILSKLLSTGKYIAHGSLWDADKAIRTALFKKGAESGMSDPEAANMVNKFMVNYNNTTPFEQNVMGRIFPFYRWMKGNIPLQVDQWINNTPKQMSQEVLKNAMSQAFSGQNTQDGKINTGVKLPGGYTMMVDPYTPTDEPLKMLREGPLMFLYGKVNPLLREGIDQATNKAYYPSATFAPNGKESMADISIGTQGAPTSYNVGERLNHAAGNLLPFGGFPVSQGINAMFNLPKSNKPSPTASDKALEGMLKLAGTFTSTNNPQLDQYYNTKDQQTQLQGFIKYLRKMGEPVPKDLTKQAYVKIPFPGGQ